MGEISEQIRGVSYATRDAKEAPQPGYLPILRATNIGEDGLLFDDLVFVPETRVSRKQRVAPNDVILAASSGSVSVVGKAVQARQGFDGGFGAFCKVLRPGPDVDPHYFGHFFRTPAYRHRVSSLAAGVNINNLKNEHLDNLKIPLPPLAEQKRIARVLDAADALRAKRREALAELDKLIQSRFLEMFGDPVVNSAGWEAGRLDNVGTVQTGTTPPSKVDGMFGGQIPFVTPGDLSDRWVDASRTVTQEGAEKSRTVDRGATLVCCIGATIGKMGKAKTLSAFNQQINAISWGDSIVDDFGFEMMRFFKKKIALDGASTTLPILKKSLFQRIEVPVPPVDMQRRFASAVKSAEEQKSRMEAHLSELDNLFHSLQVQAFSGAL